MNTHKIEAILTENGTLMLEVLPCHAGNAVEVIILEAKTPRQNVTPSSQSEKNLYPMCEKVVRYNDPTEPVGLEDWEVLQ